MIDVFDKSTPVAIYLHKKEGLLFGMPSIGAIMLTGMQRPFAQHFLVRKCSFHWYLCAFVIWKWRNVIFWAKSNTIFLPWHKFWAVTMAHLWYELQKHFLICCLTAGALALVFAMVTILCCYYCSRTSRYKNQGFHQLPNGGYQDDEPDDFIIRNGGKTRNVADREYHDVSSSDEEAELYNSKLLKRWQASFGMF